MATAMRAAAVRGASKASAGSKASRRSMAVRVKAAGFQPSAPEDRPLWYPGGEAPAHLDGSMPGDYGFDPLNLGSDPELLKWFQQAELQHCRWAMLGTVGILVPELLTKAGVADIPVWSEAGKADYGIDFLTLFWTQMFVMNWAEVRRWQDIRKPGSVNEDPLFGGYKCTGTDVGYPGGKWFDPFNFGVADNIAELRVKEVKNGRLAMVSFVGYSVQAFATGKGPVDNWFEHLANPSGANLMHTMGI